MNWLWFQASEHYILAGCVVVAALFILSTFFKPWLNRPLSKQQSGRHLFQLGDRTILTGLDDKKS